MTRTLHGYALNDAEAATLAAIRDDNEFYCGKASGDSLQWARIRSLLGWHDRLVTLLAEREAEIDRLRAELLKTPPTLEWLREQFGTPSITQMWHGAHDMYEWRSAVRWYRGHMRCTDVRGVTLHTRADVLAAVKGME
jgi:hypothetical protein